ncbi:MAG: hypothetical protein JXR71_07435 [Bacteroidales bacterium]|nr:hypothetical protein [Bacteroidales bacterium]
MKSKGKYILSVLLTGMVLLLAWQCNPDPVNPAIDQYSYLNPIVNPPDTFQVIYNLSTYGNKSAYITFQDSAVWKIQILSDTRAIFGVVDKRDSSLQLIGAVDTLGFQGNISYTFIANNNNIDNLNSYFVQFTKLPIDYSSYPKKF